MSWAEHLGDRPCPTAAQIHLEQAVLRLHEPCVKNRSFAFWRRDVRDAPAVAHDGRRRRQPFDVQRAGSRRQPAGGRGSAARTPGSTPMRRDDQALRYTTRMGIKDGLLAEFDHEMATTRKLLARLVDDKLAWKPHDKSMTLGGSARISPIRPIVSDEILNKTFLDMASLPRHDGENVGRRHPRLVRPAVTRARPSWQDRCEYMARGLEARRSGSSPSRRRRVRSWFSATSSTTAGS